MKEITWSCDKCGEPIHVGRVTFEMLTGAERLRRPVVDLCGECATGLWSWLDSAEAPGGQARPLDGRGAMSA